MAKTWLEGLDRSSCRSGDLDAFTRSMADLERSPAFHRGEVRWDLDAVRMLLDAMGAIPRSIPVIHVAGSKGKGSVCLLAEELVRACGAQTATFLSPHLERWGERFRFSGQPDREEDMGRALWKAAEIAASLDREPPTFFELLTAGFVERVQRQRPDVVILETGLGGRLDATNALPSDVAVITAIECEHEAILGSTLCEIAREKAGILKGETHGVSGLARWKPEAETIRDHARRASVSLWEWGCEVRTQVRGERVFIQLPDRKLSLGVPSGGPFAARNLALALAGIARLEDVRKPGFWDPGRFSSAVDSLSLPGRAEQLGGVPPVYRDGAHTPRSLRETCAWLADRTDNPPTLIVGLQQDKRWRDCLRAVRGRIGPLLALTVPGGRSRNPQELVAYAIELGMKAEVASSMDQALARARALTEPGAAILVAGSYWLIGDPTLNRKAEAACPAP